MAPYISVVIPALNEATCIGATLDAVQAAFAALPPDRAVVAEFLVVDNGSDDATADIARAHGARVVWEPVRGVAQGAAQFCRQETFGALGGYDERLFTGEDVDFYWRLKRLARKGSGHVVFVRDVRVVPSPRRFDRWPVWQTLFWTNPLIAALLRHRKAAWRGWHEVAPR